MKKHQSGVLGTYDSIADRWNECNYKTRSWVRFFRVFLKKSDVVLDAGCGNGMNAISMAPFARKVYAVDFSPKMVFYAKRNVRKSRLSKKIFVSKADLLQLPFKNSFFDIAAYFAVVHHFTEKKEWHKVFSEMNRVLKKGGLAFVTVWNKTTAKTSLAQATKRIFVHFKSKTGREIPRLYYFFSKKQLFALAKKHGFRVKEFFYETRGKKTNAKEGRNLCLVLQKR